MQTSNKTPYKPPSMTHKPASIAELQEIITMTKETVLKMAQLHGALQVTEKLLAVLTSQAASLRSQITDLKEGK